ncbi:MAG: isoprenyl transferase [Bacteroidota bacterium]
MELPFQHIDKDGLPKHIAIIMDGNGRWAKQQSKPRVFGHKNGVRAVRDVTEAAAELGIEYLTLYAFSKENWKRPQVEVDTLMKLFITTVSKELKTLNENNIRLEAIGDLDALPDDTLHALTYAIENTAHNDHMTLVLALNYSARWEIVETAKQLAGQVADGTSDVRDIDEELFESHLTTCGYPDPELLIRTSGESRVSNFLLWQISYSELIFTSTLWPDFTKADLYRAIAEYQRRERRFGMTSEQVTKS